MRRYLRGGIVLLLLPASVIAATVLVLTDRVTPRRVHLRLQAWMMQRWFRVLARAFGLRIRVRGTPHGRPVMVACNHQSWLDIVALGATLPGAFVSKAEIANWPMLGFFARSGGRTLFISRGEMRSFQSLGGELIGRLRDGERVIFFPEGTVNDAPEPMRFKPRLFRAALASGCAVQPVALAYVGGDGAAFATMNQTQPFVPHMMRFWAARRTEVVIEFTPVIKAEGEDHRALAQDARAQIVESLIKLSHEG
ncbi:MAG TPA: lysophospholipid acyltransferase family protein [Gammaproteobacteria bacterium]|nr:lysophospholipid acyltransferase family protein [Gammaproteobacteria bacterium]